MRFSHDLPRKLGIELTPEQQHHVLAVYVHRHTRDHKPAWARKNGKTASLIPSNTPRTRNGLRGPIST